MSADAIQAAAGELKDLPVSGIEHQKRSSSAKWDITSPRSVASTGIVLNAGN